MRAKNGYKLVFIICFFIVLSAAINMIATIYSIHKTALDGERQLFLTQVKNISDRLELELSESVSAAKAIILSPFFAELLEREAELGRDEIARRFSSYVEDFNAYFNYQSLSIISHKTGDYYTEKGYHKTIDTKNDAHDLWYKLFIDSKKSYTYTIDYDEAHDDKWMLFGDVRINDKNGNLLGVSGFGKDMAYLKNLLAKLEAHHNLKIYFMDSADNVVLGSNSQNIKNRGLFKSKSGDDSFSLKEQNGYFIGKKYIEQIGWSLVVEKQNTILEMIFELVGLNVITTLVVLVVFVGLCAIIIARKQAHLLKIAHIDALSGVLNRKGGEEKIAELIKSGSQGIFALIDADKFKEINDTFGHGAGDEVIKKIAHTLSLVADKNSVVFRLGGDEFGLFSSQIATPAQAQGLFDEIFEQLNKDGLKAIASKRIELSVGASFLLGGDDFYSIYERADKALYESKKAQGSALSLR